MVSTPIYTSAFKTVGKISEFPFYNAFFLYRICITFNAALFEAERIWNRHGGSSIGRVAAVCNSLPLNAVKACNLLFQTTLEADMIRHTMYALCWSYNRDSIQCYPFASLWALIFSLRNAHFYTCLKLQSKRAFLHTKKLEQNYHKIPEIPVASTTCVIPNIPTH